MGDRPQMGNFIAMGILGGKTQTGSPGHMAEFHGNGGITAKANNYRLLDGNLSRLGSLFQLLG